MAIFFFVFEASAQNTKGDKPAGNIRGAFLRVPKAKSNTRRGDKAYTKDIAGRKRVRTKDKSSASHIVYQQPNPYKGRQYRKKGDQAYKGTRDGSPLRVRSISSGMARSNVYPQKGPYVNNKSSLRNNQKVITRTARGKRIYKSNPSSRDRAFAGGANYGSASRPFITRGRKNVYWGKYSKGEKAVTNDLTGRPLRMRNFHSGGGGIGNSDTLKMAHRRPHRERSNAGQTGGYVSASGFGEKPWLSDLSGHKIRKRPPRKGERNGLFFEAPFRPSPQGGDRRGKMLPGGGYRTTGKGKPFNSPLPPRTPGIGSQGIGNFQGKFKRGDYSPGFSHAGGDYSGNLKRKRTPKGGGSISGKFFNNGGVPIDVKGPGIGSQGIGNFQGKFKRGDYSPGFSHAGGDYTGNLKRKRTPKGGGSISGKLFNNNGQPIEVRGPGIGSQGIGKFQGNLPSIDKGSRFGWEGAGYKGSIRAKRPAKGGGSISGKHFNNDGQPIEVRGPGIGSQGIGKFQGNIPSVNKGSGFGWEGAGYQGSMKRKRPPKGGGSISGRHWNNDGNPLQPTFGGPGFDKPAHFRGKDLKADIAPEFGRQGYGYTGTIKAKKPIHGGGSVSDRPMNNDGKPIDVRLPASADAKAANYSGKIRLPLSLWNYVQNPHANDKSLKKRKPNPNTYLAGDLQVVRKQEKYEKKPHAAKGAMLGIGPGKGSADAATYDHAVKQLWSYKHNPSSDDEAMRTIAPGKWYKPMNEYHGKLKRVGSYTHNPSSHDRALKVIGPGKAYARINDYQGNTRMRKFNDSRLHPDAQFAHGSRDNVKEDRTLMMNIKLLWARFFKKNDTQPGIVKEKERKPRYDKKEKDLWKVLYD